MKKQRVVLLVVASYNKKQGDLRVSFFFEILLANRYLICYNIPEIVRKRKINDYFTKPELGPY